MDIQKFKLNNNEPLDRMIAPLLAWYDEHARILPWRENTDPYRVWVSEIMLQQTRVEAVKPYFKRFMAKLPTLKSLAGAKEEELLKLWEGLGYYARVRNLQKAAQKICEDYDGVFPENYEEILSLPGIGEYTAGAVSSISFGKPVPAVDGNVLRVFTRITEVYEDITVPAFKKQVTKALADIYPKTRCGDFTQSIMELGATICTPNGFPKCDICPLLHLCKAFKNQTQVDLPVKAKKQSRKQEKKTVFILRCEDKIAIRKREKGGLLGGLWEFSNIDGDLSLEQTVEWAKKHRVQVKQISLCGTKKHIFTHVEWKMNCYLVDCKEPNGEFTWVTRETLGEEITLPTAFKKFLVYLK